MFERQSQGISGLESLFDYHIKEHQLPSGYTVALGQTGLALIAAAGFLYFIPAAEFADHENLGIDKQTQITLNVISTCYSAFVVLCAATIFFYRFHVKPQHILNELIDILEPPFSAAEYWRKNAIIGTAAAFSAVPFVTIAYMYYSSLPNYLFYPFLAYIFLANTFLHFLPIKLILDDPFYGAVPRYLKAQLFSCLGWKEELKIPLDQNIVNESNRAMTSLNFAFMLMMNDPQNAKSILNEVNHLSYEGLYAWYQAKVSQQAIVASDNLTLTPREAWVSKLAGVMLVDISCIGYLLNPSLVFVQELGFAWWQTLLLTCLPTFFLAVLFTYFGDTMGQRLCLDLKKDIRYVYRCFVQDSKNPPVFLETPILKLYPKTAFACMVANVFLAVFSAAAAMEMISYAFENAVSKTTLMALYVIAQIGVSIVAVYAPLDYQKMLMTYYALYLETDIRHKIMMFHESMNEFQMDCGRLKPNEETQQKMISNLLMSGEEEGESKKTRLAAWYSWCFPKSSEQSELLLDFQY